MAQFWKITEAIHDAMDQATEAGKQAADEWTGSAQEDRNDYASVVYDETETGPDDKPITNPQRTVIERIAAELTEQAAAWLAANPAETGSLNRPRAGERNMDTTRQTYSRCEVEILVSAKTAVELLDANGNPRHKRHDTLKDIEVEAIHILSRYAMNSIMGPSSPMWGTTE